MQQGSRQPMPRHIEPMKARLGELPRDDDAYGYEIKWDGVRALLYYEQGGLALESRNLLDITKQYPELAPLGTALGARSVVLDGEIVAPDERGRSNFQRLQARMHLGSESAVRQAVIAVPVVYMLFDVLYLDGGSTMAEPYTERRRLLTALALEGPAWQTPAHVEGGGAALLAAAQQQGLEGLVAKRLDSPYSPGKRAASWIKVKVHRRQEFVVGGYALGEGRRSGTVGALLVGHYDGDDLVFAGKVGTGFTDATLAMLERELAARTRLDSPFTRGQIPRKVIHVDPELVAEVEFTEWTDAGTLRHPSFKGLRTDKAPRVVVREE